jgi:hypothetical protein
MKTIMFSTKIFIFSSNYYNTKMIHIKSLLYSLKNLTLCNNMKQKPKEIGDHPPGAAR